MKLFPFFVSMFCLSVIVSCTKDVGPNPDLLPKAANNCDSVTFANTIQPIINNSCATPGCHEAGFPYGDFTSYGDIKIKIDAGSFKARVIDQAPSPMPPLGSPAPTDAELNSIKCWLEAGAPNN